MLAVEHLGRCYFCMVLGTIHTDCSVPSYIGGWKAGCTLTALPILAWGPQFVALCKRQPFRNLPIERRCRVRLVLQLNLLGVECV